MSALSLSLVGMFRHHGLPEGKDLLVFGPWPKKGTQRKSSNHDDRQFHRRRRPLFRMACADEHIKPDLRDRLTEAVRNRPNALHQFFRSSRRIDHLMLHQKTRTGIEPISVLDEGQQRVFQRSRIVGHSDRALGRLIVGELGRCDHQIDLAAEVVHAGATRDPGPFAYLGGRRLAKAPFYDAVYGGLYEALSRRAAALFLGIW